ncbi:MAG: hypothetical protein B6D58_06885, partial [candidate division Zixibacteria bacterium 4484_95]
GIDPELKNAISVWLDNIRSFLPDVLLEERLKSIINKSDLSKKINKISRSWSMKDAIYYAYTMVKSVVEIDKIVNGDYLIENDMPPKTGGDILICIVTRGGVRWIIPPDYTPSWQEDFGY